MFIKVNITGNVVDWLGRNVMFQDQTMPLRGAILSALTQVSEEDRSASTETRMLRIDLARKVSTQDIVELTLDNVILIARYLTRALVHPTIYTSFISAVEQGIARTSAPVPNILPDAAPTDEPGAQAVSTTPADLPVTHDIPAAVIAATN